MNYNIFTMRILIINQSDAEQVLFADTYHTSPDPLPSFKLLLSYPNLRVDRVLYPSQ